MVCVLEPRAVGIVLAVEAIARGVNLGGQLAAHIARSKVLQAWLAQGCVDPPARRLRRKGTGKEPADEKAGAPLSIIWREQVAGETATAGEQRARATAGEGFEDES